MSVIMSSKGQVSPGRGSQAAEAAARDLRRHAARFIIRGDDRLEVTKVDAAVRDLKGAMANPPRGLSLEKMDRAGAGGVRRVVR